MALVSVLSYLRRHRLPSTDAFLAPVPLSESTLVLTVLGISSNLLNVFSDKSFPCQHMNARSLIRKIEILVMLFEYLHDSGNSFALSSTVKLCFEEFYVLLYQSTILLDYCLHSSPLWLLTQNCMVSHYFHDLDREMSIVLDVFPLQELVTGEDVKEQVELLKKQLQRSVLFIDPKDDVARTRLLRFVEEFEFGKVPDHKELQALFLDRLGLRDAKRYTSEIQFLEALACTYEDDIEPTSPVLKGIVVLTQYCRFLFCGLEDDEGMINFENHRKQRKNWFSAEIAETFVTVPKEFFCSISLNLMHDPVVVSTGQTYDRSSISQWLKVQQVKGEHYSCPSSGQLLTHICLVPNRALRRLISLWCFAQGIALDHPADSADTSTGTLSVVPSTRAVIEANRATAKLLIEQLSSGPDVGKTVAARGLQMLAGVGEENALYIAEAGAIPLLQKLLSSPNPVAQEISVNAICTLSVYNSNKSLILEEVGCLELIVKVLRYGYTEVARQNAVAVLLSLSAVHGYKTRITDKEGAISGMLWLLKEGRQREKEVAIIALCSLASHVDNCSRMIEAGAVKVLAEALLGTEGVAETAVDVLGFFAEQPLGAKAVREEITAILGLLALRHHGTQRARGKANMILGALRLLCSNCNRDFYVGPPYF